MRSAVLTLLALLPAESVNACAVCFGISDKSLIDAYMWGIFILMGATMAIITGLIYTIYRIECLRAERAQAK